MFRIAFVIKESNFNASTDEYFPAYELAEQLTSLYGHRIDFITPASWNKPDVFSPYRYVVVMTEDFPLHLTNKPCVAWLRKALNAWIAKPDIHHYQLIMVASRYGQEFIKEHTGKTATVLRHAVGEQFKNPTLDPKYESDYCFVGNQGRTRMIETALEPYGLGYRFRLYGHRWEQHIRWKPYWKGPVEYQHLYKIYGSTKIVIDDGDQWGCVNTRVFDALAAGALILTNDKIGNIDTFECQLPVYRDRDELAWLLRYYLEHEDMRKSLVGRLQEFLTRHTYQNRAKVFQEVLFQHAHRN